MGLILNHQQHYQNASENFPFSSIYAYENFHIWLMTYEDSDVKEEQMLHISCRLIKHFYQVIENISPHIYELIQDFNQL